MAAGPHVGAGRGSGNHPEYDVRPSQLPLSARSSGSSADALGIRRRSSRQSSERTRSLTASPRPKTHLDLIEKELVALRPKLVEQTARRERLQVELRELRREEKLESQELQRQRFDKKEKRSRVVSKLQAGVRGWLTRKHFVWALNIELKEQIGIACQLPDQLRNQLRSLRHAVHDLKFRPDDIRWASTKLQAWWRAILARRVAWVFRIAKQMRDEHDRLTHSATQLQAWYRASVTRVQFRVQIQIKMAMAKKKQIEEMEEALKVIIGLQRTIRTRLAHKRIKEARAAREAQKPLELADIKEEAPRQEPKVFVDNWRPRGEGAASAIVVTSSSPKKDREVEKLEAAGLVPFYSSSSKQLVRHRIGGPAAFRMQQQLGFGTTTRRSAEGAASVDGDDEEVDGEHDPEFNGNLWDFYPEGITMGFLDKLDEDTWPWERPDQAKRKKAEKRKAEKERKKANRTLCTTLALPGPSNTERRAKAREDATEAVAANQTTGAHADAGAELHPLFVNAPPLQPSSVPPAVASTRGRSHVCMVKQTCAASADEDVSWNDATSFYGERAPRRRPLGGQSWQPIKRVGAVASPRQQLAIAY